MGVPPQVLFGQLLLGLFNGSFHALSSLGLAVIFGLAMSVAMDRHAIRQQSGPRRWPGRAELLFASIVADRRDFIGHGAGR